MLSVVTKKILFQFQKVLIVLILNLFLQPSLFLHKIFTLFLNFSPTATVIFNMMLMLCSSFGIFASLFLIVGLTIDCKPLLLPWIVTLILDIFVEASHFVYVVAFEKVELQKSIFNSTDIKKIPFTFQVEFKVLTAFIFTVDIFVLLLNVSWSFFSFSVFL